MHDPSQHDHVVAPPRRAAVEDQRFWQAIDAGQLLLAHCACGKHYARAQACLVCGAPASTHAWEPASGQGVVQSFIVFDKPYHAWFADRLPYLVAVVRLAEGPELLTNLVDIAPEAAAIGMPVTMFITARDGQNIHQASARGAGPRAAQNSAAVGGSSPEP